MPGVVHLSNRRSSTYTIYRPEVNSWELILIKESKHFAIIVYSEVGVNFCDSKYVGSITELSFSLISLIHCIMFS